MLEQAPADDLRIDGAVGHRALPVQIKPACNCVGWRIGLDGLVRVLVPSHGQPHVQQRPDSALQAAENIGSWVGAVRVEQPESSLSCSVTRLLANAVKVRPVVAGPEPVETQLPGHIRLLHHPWYSFEHVEAVVGDIHPRLEVVVVHNHPLGIAGTTGPLGKHGSPLGCCPGHAIDRHDVHEVGDLHIDGEVGDPIVQQRIQDLQGGVRHHQAAVHDVVVIGTAHAPWVARHPNVGCVGVGGRKLEIVVLENPRHLRVVVPSGVADKNVLVFVHHLDQGRAMPSLLQPVGPVADDADSVVGIQVHKDAGVHLIQLSLQPGGSRHASQTPRRWLRGGLQQRLPLLRSLELLPSLQPLGRVGEQQLGQLRVAVDGPHIHHV
mmetsp:Transcript_75609/g.202080  ORF Transcript_75609/g.202080 Transcript_75609/m.202080 type:complete len:379 (-) Transcript_75609:844-1980(-)